MSYYWDHKNVFNLTGQILFYSSFTFIVPIIISLIFKEGPLVLMTYFLIFLFVFLIGRLLRKTVLSEYIYGITIVQAIIVVCVVWLAYGFFAALPFYFLSPELTFLDAFFESMSSLTTTGLTMYPELIPSLSSLAFWRSFISWIGGLGIVVLAFFGLMKGVFGSTKLMSAEGRDRIRPSLQKTVINMWVVYIILTLIGVFLLYLFGMSLFDAFNYSMSAVSTTGSQSNAASLSGIGNTPIFITLIVLMLLSATSFILHFTFYLKRSFKVYLKDVQFIVLLLLVFLSSLIIFLKLKGHNFITVLLNVVSMITCGGFATLNTNEILLTAPFVFLIFLILMFIGGSSNSTAGGIKIERLIILIKSVFWKIKQINLPNIAYFPKKYNGQIIENSKIRTIHFLFFIWLFFVLLGTFAFTFYGYSIQESIFEVISAQSNVGFSVGITEQTMPPFLKVMLIINMWVGRLEIIPILSIIGLMISRKHFI